MMLGRYRTFFEADSTSPVSPTPPPPLPPSIKSRQTSLSTSLVHQHCRPKRVGTEYRQAQSHSGRNDNLPTSPSGHPLQFHNQFFDYHLHQQQQQQQRQHQEQLFHPEHQHCQVSNNNSGSSSSCYSSSCDNRNEPVPKMQQNETPPYYFPPSSHLSFYHERQTQYSSNTCKNSYSYDQRPVYLTTDNTESERDLETSTQTKSFVPFQSKLKQHQPRTSYHNASNFNHHSHYHQQLNNQLNSNETTCSTTCVGEESFGSTMIPGQQNEVRGGVLRGNGNYDELFYNLGHDSEMSAPTERKTPEDYISFKMDSRRNNDKKCRKRRNHYKPSFSEIQKNFDLSLEEAATKLNLSTTKLKKLCREYGITHWPYRRIKNVQMKIKTLKHIVESHQKVTQHPNHTISEQEPDLKLPTNSNPGPSSSKSSFSFSRKSDSSSLLLSNSSSPAASHPSPRSGPLDTSSSPVVLSGRMKRLLVPSAQVINNNGSTTTTSFIQVATSSVKSPNTTSAKDSFQISHFVINKFPYSPGNKECNTDLKKSFDPENAKKLLREAERERERLFSGDLKTSPEISTRKAAEGQKRTSINTNGRVHSSTSPTASSNVVEKGNVNNASLEEEPMSGKASHQEQVKEDSMGTSPTKWHSDQNSLTHSYISLQKEEVPTEADSPANMERLSSPGLISEYPHHQKRPILPKLRDIFPHQQFVPK